MGCMTRGDILRYSIAFASLQQRLCLAPCRQDGPGSTAGPHEDERYAVADHVVSQLKERGDPWHLEDEAKPGRGPTT
jgi:hypothetical protein